MAFLKLSECIIWNSLAACDTVFDRETVYIAKFDLSALYLISEKVGENIACRLTDDRADPVASAYSDDELVERTVIGLSA